MADRALHSPAFLRKLISYDPETGDMRWLPRSIEQFQKPGHPAERQQKSWNARHAGNPVFTASNGYQTGKIYGVWYNSHRLAWALHYGVWPAGLIDHINGDRADNSIANLREVSQLGNSRNQGVNARNKSGVTGVYRTKEGKWHAQIHNQGKTQNLGHYASLEEAAMVRKRAECELGYHPNHGTRPSHATIAGLAAAALGLDLELT